MSAPSFPSRVSGAVLAVPVARLPYARHPDSPREALLEAVNGLAPAV